MTKVHVLLVDDHALFREGLTGILNSQPDFEVVGQAADGLAAVVMARKLLPDLVLMDVAMPGCDGVEATALLKQELPAVVVVMLTMFDEDEKLFEAIKCGAQGYLLKSIHADELLALLRGAMQGEAAITPMLGSRILEAFRHLSHSQLETRPPAELALTAREYEVMRLVAGGATDKEIAAELVISIHTVKSHVRSVLAKLHLTHRHEAARYLIANQRIRPPSIVDG